MTGLLTPAVAAVLAPLLAGCNDERSEEQPAAKAVEMAEDSSGNPEWLDVMTNVEPADWLVQRKAAKGEPPPDAASVKATDAVLQRAKLRFGDSPRMVANRAAQLETMLADAGIQEDATELIDVLTRTTDGGTRPIGGFAAICQYYFNLRQQGLDRKTALASLKARYGAGA